MKTRTFSAIAVLLLVVSTMFGCGLQAVHAQNCVNGRCLTPIQSTITATETVVQGTIEVIEQIAPVQRTVQLATAPVRYIVQEQPVRSVSQAALKTAQQVAEGTLRHVGGAYAPGARYEGVGFSTRSENDALQKCCYSNRPIVDRSVQYGYNRKLRAWGWFATIHTR